MLQFDPYATASAAAVSSCEVISRDSDLVEITIAVVNWTVTAVITAPCDFFRFSR